MWAGIGIREVHFNVVYGTHLAPHLILVYPFARPLYPCPFHGGAVVGLRVDKLIGQTLAHATRLYPDFT